MPYLTPPKTSDFRKMQDDRRQQLERAWNEVSLHLKRHKDRLNLSDWEEEAIRMSADRYEEAIKDELETLLRKVFTAAGKNYGIEQEEFRRRKKNKHHANVD